MVYLDNARQRYCVKSSEKSIRTVHEKVIRRNAKYLYEVEILQIHEIHVSTLLYMYIARILEPRAIDDPGSGF
jgi:hypothetical protein